MYNVYCVPCGGRAHPSAQYMGANALHGGLYALIPRVVQRGSLSCTLAPPLVKIWELKAGHLDYPPVPEGGSGVTTGLTTKN